VRSNGKQVALDLLLQHRPFVLRLCRIMLRDSSESEDAAQQVFLHAYRALGDGTRPLEPRAWLAEIARNECRSRVRRSAVRTEAPLPEEVPALGLDLAELAAARRDRAHARVGAKRVRKASLGARRGGERDRVRCRSRRGEPERECGRRAPSGASSFCACRCHPRTACDGAEGARGCASSAVRSRCRARDGVAAPAQRPTALRTPRISNQLPLRRDIVGRLESRVRRQQLERAWPGRSRFQLRR
jgi:RNA polymerase sigma factor (sigma-70 family)